MLLSERRKKYFAMHVDEKIMWNLIYLTEALTRELRHIALRHGHVNFWTMQETLDEVTLLTNAVIVTSYASLSNPLYMVHFCRSELR